MKNFGSLLKANSKVGMVSAVLFLLKQIFTGRCSFIQQTCTGYLPGVDTTLTLKLQR